uniref:ATP synthase F0 subunit 8 n=1 Tax=Pennaria disticha TaxID=264068 RepID=G9ISZ0_9CNID|nr:ATP synthase F0 subunit 8 [Pennaria disticha]
MSQLDLSLALSQLLGLFLILYIYYIFINDIIIKYFYIEQFRNKQKIILINKLEEKKDININIVKKILNN